MADYDNIVRERQKAIRREIDRRDLSIKAIHMDGGWETPSTVLSYFPADELKQPATMSVAALFRLLKTNAVPTELLSLLMPDGFAIVRTPEGINHDEIEEAARDFLATKGRAHHPESPAGRDISACEDSVLRRKAVALRAIG